MFQWKRHKRCDDCPFMTSGKGLQLRKSLRPGRWREILKGLRAGEHFLCHKTTIDAELDENGEEVNYPKGLICAGALAYQTKLGLSSNVQRVCERLEWIEQQRANNQQGERHDVGRK